MERSRLPPGMAMVIAARGGRNFTSGQYRAFVLIITFLSYVSNNRPRPRLPNRPNRPAAVQPPGRSFRHAMPRHRPSAPRPRELVGRARRAVRPRRGSRAYS